MSQGPVYAELLNQNNGQTIIYAYVEPDPPNVPVGETYNPLVYSLGYIDSSETRQLVQIWDSEGLLIWEKLLPPKRSEIFYDIPPGRRPRRYSASISLTAGGGV